jgi:F-type H+-transporting ATPase subunit alpha
MATTQLNPSEISELIKTRIEKVKLAAEARNEGTVTSVSDGIVRIHGLADVMQGEMIELPDATYALALNLERDSVGAVVLGDYEHLREGDTAKTTSRILEVPTGPELLGRVVNALGEAIDGKGPIDAKTSAPVEAIAPGVIWRKSVSQPVQTGYKSVDSMIPIGRGQRELIIGDRQTGKTALAIDAIINQKGSGIKCIYVAIGQKNSTIANIVRKLEEFGAMAYTTVVAASASESAAMQYIAAYSGCTMGEYFRDRGEDALIIYDDLSKQAVAYRQISLLLRRPPGREAYPGDVFYLHSRLLERCAKLSEAMGGGSMTGLPIIETKANDISAYIPTNVISITDGQIFLESDLFNSGVRPAINVGTSVSRVGGDAQIKPMKRVAGRLRLDLAQFRELEAFSAFASDLDRASRAQLDRGGRLVELLKQPNYSPYPVEEQVVAVWIGTEGKVDDIPIEEVRRFEGDFREYLRHQHKDLLASLADGNWDDDVVAKLNEALDTFKRNFLAQEHPTRVNEAPAEAMAEGEESQETVTQVIPRVSG